MRKHSRTGHNLRRKTQERINFFEENIRYAKDVLPNGLRVVTIETPHLRNALLAVYVRTGSRHENEANNGVSHFLEHMFFRGSQRHADTVRMNAAVEAGGGNLNGVTTRDHGYYFTPIHPKHVRVGIDILGDMLIRPRMVHMSVERDIILEEMLDEVDETGRDIDLDNLSKRQLFPAHPLSLKIAGTPASVQRMTKAALWTHFHTHYVSGNMVFAAAGNISRAKILEDVHRAFRALPEGLPSHETTPPLLSAGPFFQHVHHDEAQTELRISFRTVPEHHEDYPALQLIRRILDDGLSSWLPVNIIEKRGLAYSMHAAIETFHDVGLFEVDAATAPPKASKVLSEVCRTLGMLCDQGVSLEELRRAQRRHRMALEFSLDSPGELAGWFGGTELFRTPESFEDRCRALERVSRRQLQNVAQKYFRKSNLTVTTVGPERGKKALEKATRDAEGLPN